MTYQSASSFCAGREGFRHNPRPMFTYLDPAVRERLVADGKLVRIDRDGNTVPDHVEPGHTISILGPIPLPLTLHGRHIDVTGRSCSRPWQRRWPSTVFCWSATSRLGVSR